MPPLPEGLAAHYLRAHTQPGDLVFDPFGQAPSVVVEALSLDRRIVVASFNPISRLVLSLALRPPSAAQLRAALTVLADAPAGRNSNERLETNLRQLYRSTCAECEAAVIVDSYEWESAVDEPVTKTYICANCGPQESPLDDADRALARRYTRNGPDYHFLLDRVAAFGDPDRVHAEEAMAVYPPRTLVAIGAVLIKLEGLDPRAETRRLLAGLLVAALDAASMLTQERPRALVVPRRYRELNFWLALEQAIGLLAGVPVPDRSATLPGLLDAAHGPSIYSHTGTVRDLAGLLPPGSCRLVLTALPRPNQAYWTLSALWSAWLWGRESAEALRAVLRRRRYDWAWHARALQRTLSLVAPTLRVGRRVVGLLPDAEPGFSAAVFAAGSGAGLALEGAVLRADTGEAQFQWARWASQPPTAPGGDAEATARTAARECLAARAEPARWASVHFAAWQALVARRALAWNADEPMRQGTQALEQAAGDERTFERYGASGSDLATGQWFLTLDALGAGLPGLPLADRVEAQMLRLLASGEPVDEIELQVALYAALPGPLTPGRGLVLACLSSYAQPVDTGRWQLRPEDAPAARAMELRDIDALLRGLASRHGYEAAGSDPQTWLDAGEATYQFAVQSSAMLGPRLLAPGGRARRRFLVLPGGRAGLAEYKLRRDPRLRQALRDGNWVIVKFRHIRLMASDASLTRATLEPALGADPIEASQQLALPT